MVVRHHESISLTDWAKVREKKIMKVVEYWRKRLPNAKFVFVLAATILEIDLLTKTTLVVSRSPRKYSRRRRG